MMFQDCAQSSNQEELKEHVLVWYEIAGRGAYSYET